MCKKTDVNKEIYLEYRRFKIYIPKLALLSAFPSPEKKIKQLNNKKLKKI